MTIEEKLKDAFANGDQNKIELAFSTFYKANYDLVKKIIAEKVGYHIWLEDVIADTFVAILENKDRLGEIKDLKKYLFQVARNIAKKTYKNELNKSHDDIDNVITISNDDSLANIDEKNIVQRIESSLKYPSDKIFILREGFEYTFLEIASILNLGEDLVYYRYKKALEKLRKEFKKGP